MKIPKDYKKILLMIGIPVILVVIATIAIVLFYLNGKTDRVKEEQPKEVKYANVYVVGCSENEIQFVDREGVHSLNGNFTEPVSGIADLVAVNQVVTEIHTKSDSVAGVLESYSDQSMVVRELGDWKRNEQVPIFDCKNNQVQAVDFNALVVGQTKCRFVMEDNCICAILLEEPEELSTIRVMITNKDQGGIFYEKVSVLDGNQKEHSYSPSFFNGTEKEVLTEGPFLIVREDGSVSIPYKGTLTVLHTEQGYVLVNEVDMETYIAGVLPSEMPRTFQLEALKAQAVCARSYGLKQLHHQGYAMYGANLDDTTNFQVYNQVEASEITNLAVEQTTHQVLKKDDQIITCFYFSTSAGMTNSIELWKDRDSIVNQDFSYLVAKNATAFEQLDISGNEVFHNFISVALDGFDKNSPFYRWTSTLSLDKEVETEEELGKLKSVEVTKRNASGYVLELTMNYEKGKKVYTDENQIRKYLGQYQEKILLPNGQVREDMTMIPSACFEISEVKDGMITLSGGGLGHGIGMSQYGANGMAETGCTYDEILNFYYTGVTLTER